MTAAPQPGWYPDPAGAEHLYRWWDGQTWTDGISESQQAPAPGSAVLQDDVETSRRPRSTSRAVIAVTLGFALFISAGVGAGLLIWRDASPKASGGGGAPATGTVPTATTTPAIGRLEQSSRRARIGSATMTLPGAPYKIYGDPKKIDGVFDVFFLAGCIVHDQFDGRHDWNAMVGFAHVSAELAASKNLEEAGQAAMATLATRFFEGHATTVKPISSADRAVDGNPGMLFIVDVHYAVKKLPSTHDRVTGLVVRLGDGSLIAAISSVPNDADAETVRLAAESLESLTIS